MPTPSPLPDSIRIAPHDYKVVRKTRAELPLINGHEPNAYIDCDRLEIAILKRARRSKAQEWAVHECLHGLWPEGFGFEEELVTRLSPRLLQWLQDNPELLKFLTS
jgi:hypothetical protein